MEIFVKKIVGFLEKVGFSTPPDAWVDVFLRVFGFEAKKKCEKKVKIM